MEDDPKEVTMTTILKFFNGGPDRNSSKNNRCRNKKKYCKICEERNEKKSYL